MTMECLNKERAQNLHEQMICLKGKESSHSTGVKNPFVIEKENYKQLKRK